MTVKMVVPTSGRREVRREKSMLGAALSLAMFVLIRINGEG
jgi:hypothetical protein